MLFRVLGLSARTKPNIGWVLAARTAAIIGNTAMENASFNLYKTDSQEDVPRMLTRQETTESCILDMKSVILKDDTVDSLQQEKSLK